VNTFHCKTYLKRNKHKITNCVLIGDGSHRQNLTLYRGKIHL